MEEKVMYYVFFRNRLVWIWIIWME